VSVYAYKEFGNVHCCDNVNQNLFVVIAYKGKPFVYIIQSNYRFCL